MRLIFLREFQNLNQIQVTRKEPNLSGKHIDFPFKSLLRAYFLSQTLQENNSVTAIIIGVFEVSAV